MNRWRTLLHRYIAWERGDGRCWVCLPDDVYYPDDPMAPVYCFKRTPCPDHPDGPTQSPLTRWKAQRRET